MWKRKSALPGEKMVALAGLHAAGAATPLPRIGQAHPLGLQRGQVRVQVEAGDLDSAAVDDKDDVVDGDGGLGNVGGDDDLAGARRRPLKDGPLAGGRHEAVQRVDAHWAR